MTKEKSKNLIKKVRKEIEPETTITVSKSIDYYNGFFDGVDSGITAPIKEEKNHAITLIIVWLAILTVLAIYKSL